MFFANDARFPFAYSRTFRGRLRHVLFEMCLDLFFLRTCHTHCFHDFVCSWIFMRNIRGNLRKRDRCMRTEFFTGLITLINKLTVFLRGALKQRQLFVLTAAFGPLHTKVRRHSSPRKILVHFTAK